MSRDATLENPPYSDEIRHNVCLKPRRKTWASQLENEQVQATNKVHLQKKFGLPQTTSSPFFVGLKRLERPPDPVLNDIESTSLLYTISWQSSNLRNFKNVAACITALNKDCSMIWLPCKRVAYSYHNPSERKCSCSISKLPLFSTIFPINTFYIDSAYRMCLNIRDSHIFCSRILNELMYTYVCANLDVQQKTTNWTSELRAQ